MNKTLWLWIERLFVLYVLLLLGSMIFPSRGPSPNRFRASCQSNLKQMGLAVKQYLQDYDERFPLVTSGKQGWANTLEPYIKSNAIFQCPETRPTPSSFPTRLWHRLFGAPPAPPSTGTDYWYNARLARLEDAKVDSVALTVMFGDGINDAKTNASLSSLPTQWLKDASPARRHLDGINLAFADGHVKWVSPETVTTRRAKEGRWTFSTN